MKIPFLKFSECAQIPLTPAYIMKIKEAMDANGSSQPQMVVNLADNIMVKIYIDYSVESVQVFEYDNSPHGFVFKSGKVDSYSTTSLQTGSCFTDLYQGKFKTYVLKQDIATLVEECEYTVGHLNGEHKYFLDDVVESTFYRNDIKEGPYSITKLDGSNVLVGAHINDQRDGAWKLYYANGVIRKIINYSYLVGGLYGLTQEFNELGSVTLYYTKLLDLLHGEHFEKAKNKTTYYLFDAIVEKEVYDTYDWKHQDEMFANVGRSFLEAV
jgi:antitoxin component YwqK of YwqJK toxin-antitoxin module